MESHANDFLEGDKNKTVFCISLSFKDGKQQLSSESRLIPGEEVKVVKADNLSDGQLYAVCAVLDDLFSALF